MMTKKLLALALTLALTMGLFVACGNNNQTVETTPSAEATNETTDNQAETTPSEEPAEVSQEVTGDPIKIGHIADLTGVESSVGIQAKEALEFAVEAMGGKIGNRPIEIITEDSQSTASVAADVAKKLVEQDKVVAILGPTQIGHKSTVSEYIKEAGIPLIFYNGTPAGLFKSNPWLVGSAGATPQMPTVMADYVYNEMGYETVHTLSMENTGGRSYIDPFVEAYEALGGAIATQVWVPQNTEDFSPYLVSLKEADALVAWTSSSDAIALWKVWSDLGLTEKLPIVAAFHGGMTDYFVPLAVSKSNPAAAEAMLGTVAPIMYTYSIDIPENKAFVEAWTAKFGAIPPGSNLPGDVYTALLLLKTAVESLDGDTTPDKLIEAIFAADITGPAGHLYFADGSHAATKDVYVVKVVKLDNGSYNYEVVKTYSDVPPEGLAAS